MLDQAQNMLLVAMPFATSSFLLLVVRMLLAIPLFLVALFKISFMFCSSLICLPHGSFISHCSFIDFSCQNKTNFSTVPELGAKAAPGTVEIIRTNLSSAPTDFAAKAAEPFNRQDGEVEPHHDFANIRNSERSELLTPILTRPSRSLSWP